MKSQQKVSHSIQNKPTMTKSKEKDWLTIHVQLHKHNAQLIIRAS